MPHLQGQGDKPKESTKDGSATAAPHGDNSDASRLLSFAATATNHAAATTTNTADKWQQSPNQFIGRHPHDDMAAKGHNAITPSPYGLAPPRGHDYPPHYEYDHHPPPAWMGHPSFPNRGRMVGVYGPASRRLFPSPIRYPRTRPEEDPMKDSPKARNDNHNNENAAAAAGSLLSQASGYHEDHWPKYGSSPMNNRLAVDPAAGTSPFRPYYGYSDPTKKPLSPGKPQTATQKRSTAESEEAPSPKRVKESTDAPPKLASTDSSTEQQEPLTEGLDGAKEKTRESHSSTETQGTGQRVISPSSSVECQTAKAEDEAPAAPAAKPALPTEVSAVASPDRSPARFPPRYYHDAMRYPGPPGRPANSPYYPPPPMPAGYGYGGPPYREPPPAWRMGGPYPPPPPPPHSAHHPHMHPSYGGIPPYPPTPYGHAGMFPPPQPHYPGVHMPRHPVELGERGFQSSLARQEEVSQQQQPKMEVADKSAHQGDGEGVPKKIQSVAEWQRAALATGMAPSANRCVPLKAPIPSKYWGEAEKAKETPLPDFHRLVNYPDYLNKVRPNGVEGPGSASSSNGKRHCVMCGKLRVCSASSASLGSLRRANNNKKQEDGAGDNGDGDTNSSSKAPEEEEPEDTNHIIPRQNKGLCTACDVTVWVVADSGLEIKWCKGCKNFRQWAAFGDKGLATKCVRCRDRQREKYALQKDELRLRRMRQNKLSSSASSSSSTPQEEKKEDEEHEIAAAKGLRDLMAASV